MLSNISPKTVAKLKDILPFIDKSMFFPNASIVRFFVFVSLLLPVILMTAYAAPGDLDLSFGSGGKVVSPVGKISADRGFSSALQADGKIVVAGDSFDGVDGAKLIVTRINADGSLDTTFGVGGKAGKLLPNINRANAVIVQPDGKIIVGGITLIEIAPGDYDYSFLLVRFNSNGSIDNTFGANGVVVTAFVSGSNSYLTSLVLQGDGKIVAAGFTYFSSITSPQSIAVARYNPDGSLDALFDGDGKTLVNISASGIRANAVAIHTDGKIVLGGSARDSFLRTDFVLIRLNADGSLDASFDGDGKLITRIGTLNISVNALKLQADGKIVAAGNDTRSNSDVIVARYNTDGLLDASFDADGIATASIGIRDLVSGVGIQPDGKIVVGGHTTPTETSAPRFFAARYNSNGLPDASFNGNGAVIAQFYPYPSFETAMFLQPDGKITLIGYSNIGVDADILLIRYNADGSPDLSFDADGAAAIELNNSSEFIAKIALQSDGKIVAAGYGFKGNIKEIILARYNSNGSLDASFGEQGVVRSSLSMGLGANDSATDVIIQPDGKIVISAVSMENSRYFVIRYNSNGSLDASFGAAGIATIQVVPNFDEASSLALQSDGKIIAAGSSSNGSSNSGSFIRLNTDGSLDTSFGSGGKLLLPASNTGNPISSIAVQTDGKIVAAAGSGFLSSIGNSVFTVIRITANGTLDASFGGTGMVQTSFETQGSARAVAIQSDGKIVVAGSGYQAYVLARYNTDGSLDSSFDGDGKVMTPAVTNTFGILTDLAIQQNGKIVTVGDAFIGNDWDGAVFRYNTDGSLDTAFGSGGRIIASIGDGRNGFGSVLLQTDGKIIAAGYSNNGFNYDFTLVRYRGDALSTVGRVLFDYDGDGKADVSVFRPSNGVWYLQQSQNGFTGAAFGQADDKIVPADYDGDGKTDLAVFRQGTWYLQRSQAGFTGVAFGAPTDIPVPGDYDGDGKADLAVFRASTGVWYLLQSALGFTGVTFGQTGDKPVPADYDGDGKTDIAVNRGGTWYLQRSQLGFIGIQFGDSNDKLVPADYDGDGKADIAVFRPSNGTWYLQQSASGFAGIAFGFATDLPVPADYDGDGKTDVAVFRDGNWYLNRSSAGFTGVLFGAATDKPIPNVFVY